MLGVWGLIREQKEHIAWFDKEHARLCEENRALMQTIGNAGKTPIRFETQKKAIERPVAAFDTIPTGDGKVVDERRVRFGMNP